jgi:hypothetical protein
MVCLAHSEYACMSHHTHSNVHPKYLVTTIKILCNFCPCIWAKIGFQAVFAGSQSSLCLKLSAVISKFQNKSKFIFAQYVYAKQL